MKPVHRPALGEFGTGRLAATICLLVSAPALAANFDRPPGFAFPPIHQAYSPRPFRPEQYVVYRAVDSIAVDGRLDEDSWTRAPRTVDFGHIQSAATYARPHLRTRARLLWDDEHLYAAVEMEEPHLMAHVATDDEEIYDDNDIEMFIDVDGDAQNYIELEFNALGTGWDMLLPKEYNRGGMPFSHPRFAASPPWDLAGMRAAVRAEGSFNYPFDTDRGWVIELSLPWASLAATDRSGLPLPAAGRALRVNFSRVQHPWSRTAWPIVDWEDRGGLAWDWTWSPVLVYNMHVCETWGRLILSAREVTSAPDEALEQAFAFVVPPSARTPSLTGAGRPGGTGADDMALIRGGTYAVGPDHTDSTASPRGTVTVADFLIDRYEVTIGEYAEFLNATGEGHFHPDMVDPDLCGIAGNSSGDFAAVPGKESYPIVFVSQENARAFAAWRGKRLLTEHEWEIAARGAEGRTYPWGEQPPADGRANFDFRIGHTAPVGAYPQGSTPDGICDLAGNVWELVEGSWAAYPWGEVSVPPPTRGPLMRGGSWVTPSANLKSTYRDALKGNSAMVGFRCALDPGSPAE